jgi:hypothetical protein
MYSLYKFQTRGIGVISDMDIIKDTFIGNYFSKNEQLTPNSRLIYNGWVETNPLGRYLNHNINSNLYLIKKDNVIELYTNENIFAHTELTINYMDIIELIDLPEHLILEYGISDFNYIEETINLNKNII